MSVNDIDPKFFEDICGMTRQVQALVIEAIKLIKPQVEGIIRNHITDKHQIETLLDSLLDYAGMSKEGLVLFKRLCRYYFTINPSSATEYVYLYRDLYDSDDNYED